MTFEERLARAQRKMMPGSFHGRSRVATPVDLLRPQRVLPAAEEIAIGLVTSTDDMFSDSFRLAHVYTNGMVGTYRNGVGGGSGAHPIDMSDFTQFVLGSSTSPNQFYGNHFSLDWPYLYARRNSDIAKVDLTAGTAGTGVETTASGGTGVDDVAVAPGQPLGFYTVAATNTDVYQWTRSAEPSATPTLIATVTGRSLDQVVIDADGDHIWLAGNSGIIEKRANDGTFVLDLTMPGGAYVNGTCAAPSGGLIVMTEDVPSGSFTYWYQVAPDGTVTDITANVTVDGTPWVDIEDLYNVAWGAPYIHLTSYGDRIGWGGNYSYGPPLNSMLKAYHGTVSGG